MEKYFVYVPEYSFDAVPTILILNEMLEKVLLKKVWTDHIYIHHTFWFINY